MCSIEIIALLIGKKLPKLNKKLRKKSCIQFVKKYLKLNKKNEKKTGKSWSIKNYLNSIKKQEKKPLIYYFVWDKKFLKPS